MTNTEKLKELIKDKGISITFIAKKLDISRSALYNKMDNKSAFNQYEIETLCEVLNIRTLKEKEAIFFAKM